MVKVVFVHPDLGIGGAERLIVDAALALKNRGHEVTLYTAHHDSSHCFEETRDGTLDVVTAGDWLPRSCCGKFYALFAYLRMIFVSIYLVLFSGEDFDVVVCDQISACIPFLRWQKKAKILFYCHFPDLLLTQRKSFLKRLYRGPIDWLEERTTGMADTILVNSNFTAGTFKSTFTSLSNIQPEVLYPSLNFDAFDVEVEPIGDLFPQSSGSMFLSINRYERKKNLALAIEAFGALKLKLPEADWKSTHLVMAGGYDERVTENKEHYLELRSRAAELELTDNITFLRSFTDAQKLTLLDACTCLVYTPSNEHFGIVPIEAMYMNRPVIAVNSGGPLETVSDRETGYLCEPDPERFSDAMLQFVKDKGLSERLGKKGHQRVIERFSFKAFGDKLHSIVMDLHDS